MVFKCQIFFLLFEIKEKFRSTRLRESLSVVPLSLYKALAKTKIHKIVRKLGTNLKILQILLFFPK